MTKDGRVTLGVIVGHRGFFPAEVCIAGRQTLLQALKEQEIDVVTLSESDPSHGLVATYDDAIRCGTLFREHRDIIDGILVSLPDFGEEKAIAQAIRFSDLQLPVLVHAFEDDIDRMGLSSRRDSFCGKISVCSNLRQFNIKYSLTSRHTVSPTSVEFRHDLARFVSICRVVRSLRGARLGVIGTRPAGFNTVRYSERLFEHSGISVEPLSLAEVVGRASRLQDQDKRVKAKLDEINTYVMTIGIPEDSLLKMAKLGVVVDEWINDNQLVGTAIQCWTALEEFYGVAPCAIMSMMSNNLVPSACEVDVAGLVSMYILQQASGRPSALFDWNNNYGSDQDKVVAFHCSNVPKDFLESIRMDAHPILTEALGSEQAYGTLSGRVKKGALTFLRVSTNDLAGEIEGYLGEGVFTDDPLETFGGYGVMQIERLQELLQLICEHGYEHHVAISLSRVGDSIEEALNKYMGWKVSRHC